MYLRVNVSGLGTCVPPGAMVIVQRIKRVHLHVLKM